MPVKMIRNLRPGPTVWSDMESRRSIQWASQGDPSGQDIQPVSEEVFNTPSFQRALANKALAEVDESVGSAAIEAQRLSREEAQREQHQQVLSQIDRSQEESFVVEKCQGPATRGTGSCNADVTVKATEVGSRPMLCPAHSGLAHTFIEQDTGEMVERDGKLVSRMTWIRPSVESN